MLSNHACNVVLFVFASPVFYSLTRRHRAQLASQMTLDEFEVFSQIVPPIEFGMKAFSSPDAAALAPNVSLLTERINVIR